MLLGVGEPSRALTDPLLREAVPHLVVRLTEGVAVVGPFVLPGITPCLRCTDARLSEDDPAWTLLVEQYARLIGRGDRADGVPEPVDAALAALAVAWAAREVATYAEGGTPATLGATVRLSARSSEVETRRWDRHPRCGCTWGAAAAPRTASDSAPLGLNVVQHLPTRGAEWLSWPTSHAKPSRARPDWPVSPWGTPAAPPSAWASGWAAPRPRPS